MKLRLETRHRLVVIATGDDAAELETDDDAIDTVVGNGGAADLTTAPADEPVEGNRTRRNRSVGFSPTTKAPSA